VHQGAKEGGARVGDSGQSPRDPILLHPTALANHGRQCDDYGTHDGPSRPTMRQNTPPARPMTLRPHAILIGVAVSYLLQVGGGYLAATQGIVRDPGAELGGDFSVLPILQFGTIFCGGYLSGRLAGVAGFINGIAVSVAFILIWAGLNAYNEAKLVEEFGPLVLPPMNMGGIVLGDILNLTAGAFGGWLADRWGR